MLMVVIRWLLVEKFMMFILCGLICYCVVCWCIRLMVCCVFCSVVCIFG